MALRPRETDQNRDLVDPFFDGLMSPWEPLSFGFPFTHSLVPATSTSFKQLTPILSADLVESETDFHIHVDLPGVDKEDLDISFSEGNLIIKAERKNRHENTDNKVNDNING